MTAHPICCKIVTLFMLFRCVDSAVQRVRLIFFELCEIKGPILPQLKADRKDNGQSLRHNKKFSLGARVPPCPRFALLPVPVLTRKDSDRAPSLMYACDDNKSMTTKDKQIKHEGNINRDDTKNPGGLAGLGSTMLGSLGLGI